MSPPRADVVRLDPAAVRELGGWLRDIREAIDRKPTRFRCRECEVAMNDDRCWSCGRTDTVEAYTLSVLGHRCDSARDMAQSGLEHDAESDVLPWTEPNEGDAA